MSRLIKLTIPYVLVVCAVQNAQAGGGPATPWSKVDGPAKSAPEAVGSYANGCLLGAQALPVSAPGFQTIRRHRKRFFGHPSMVKFVHDYGKLIKEANLPDVLVGDLSQAQGGPLPFGHRSHQIGLDADIWFSVPPRSKRGEDKHFPSLVNLDTETIEETVWSERIPTMLKLAATDERVARIFVHWVIKKKLCQSVKGDRGWLRKVRPWWGHSRHFHVRLECPDRSADCISQRVIPEGDGCGKERWFSAAQVKRRRSLSKKKATKPKKTGKRKRLPLRCLQLVTGKN